MKPSSSARKVLFIQLRQLGDVLLTTASITSWAKSFPQDEIYFLCHSSARALLEGHAGLRGVLTYHQKDSWMDRLRLFFTIRKMKFDLTFDFMTNPRSAIFTLVAFSRERWAYRKSRKNPRFWVYNRTIEPQTESIYIVQEKNRLLKAAGAQVFSEDLVLLFSETDALVNERFFNRLSSESKLDGFRKAPKRVLLSATSRREKRLWPVENYVALANSLIEEGFFITWAWGPGERPEVEGLCARVNNQAMTAILEDASLKEFAALCTLHDMFVGNSNGLSHIAESQKLSCVVLHGPTVAASWTRSLERSRGIQASRGDIKDIDIETVFAAVLRINPKDS